jgi:hypothetical protein
MPCRSAQAFERIAICRRLTGKSISGCLVAISTVSSSTAVTAAMLLV